MDHITEENIEDTILGQLKRENILRIALTGKKGIGKTWMAKRLSLLGLKDGIFDIGLWVYMSVKQSKTTIYHNLAHQLSATRENEFDDSELDIDVVDDNHDLEVLKNEILSRVSQKKVLLVLDDEGKKMNLQDEEIEELRQVLPGNGTKVLITCVNGDGRYKSEGSNVVFDLNPLGLQKALSLFHDKADKFVMIPGAKLVVEEFISHHIGLTPAEIIVIAKTLNFYFFK